MSPSVGTSASTRKRGPASISGGRRVLALRTGGASNTAWAEAGAMNASKQTKPRTNAEKVTGKEPCDECMDVEKCFMDSFLLASLGLSEQHPPRGCPDTLMLLFARLSPPRDDSATGSNDPDVQGLCEAGHWKPLSHLRAECSSPRSERSRRTPTRHRRTKPQ